MRPADDIKRFIDKAAVRTNPSGDKAVLDAVLRAHEKATSDAPAAGRRSVRSVVMSNSYVKLALAAVVILAVLLGLSEFLSPGGKSGVAWAQVLERAEQAPTVIFDMTVEISYSADKKLAFPSKNYVSGEYGVKSEAYHEGKLFLLKYKLPRQKAAYQIRVDRKQYRRFDFSDEEVARTNEMDDPRSWLKMILSGAYTELGRSTINGVNVEGVESQQAEMAGKDGVTRLWVDVETNLPVRIEMETLGMEGGQIRPHKFIMENFEWNAPLNESLFEPNIPADYTRM